GRAADDEEVDTRLDDGLVELLRALRGERAGDRDTGCPDLGDARRDELWLDGLRVDLLHAARGLGGGKRADLLEQRLGVLVARPDTLEVEHPESAELADADGGLRRDDRVHGRGKEGDVEGEGVD